MQAHKLATEFYYYILTKHESGKVGLEYAMGKRKIDMASIEKYRLGYAPKNYHNLQLFLQKKGFTNPELVRFGLLVEKNGKVYDKFRGRLLHPIMNLRGEVVAFSGRAIFTDDPGPKYLNSPETLIYHKKELPYGAYQAKDAMRVQKFVILVEGNIDVVSSSRVGFSHIVCPLGTALTPEQLKLLGRYCETIYFAFDTDVAGKKALLRALELTEKLGILAKAINIGHYKDVDELICADPLAWKEAVQGALEIPEYIIEIYKADYNLSQASSKTDYLNLCLGYLAKVQNQLKLDHYLQKLVQLTGAHYEILVDNLNKIKNTPVEIKFNINSTVEQVESDSEELIERQTVKIKISRKLKSIINFIFASRERLRDVEELKTHYRGKLARHESGLLDEILEKKLTNSNPELIAILTEEKFTIDLDIPDIQTEIEKMLRTYVREQLRAYLKILKTQSGKISDAELINRTRQYTQKLAELG